MGVIYHKKKIYGNNPLIETIGIGGGYAPIGTIIAYMGTTAPQDYLACDGSTYNITDYKQLARFIETQFGSINYFGGDGTTTFAVPDLRGEFLRGTGTNSHENSGNGSSVGTHQTATKIPRIVTATATGAPITYGKAIEPTLADSIERSTENKYYYFPAGSISEGTATTPVKIFSSRPTNTSVLYCIKALVAGEVYSTEERVVGTWINGKPIYQKTIVDTMPTISTNFSPVTKYIDVSGLHIEYFKLIDSEMYMGTGIFDFPCAYQLSGNEDVSYARIYWENDKIYVQGNKTAMSGSTFYATIQYTKTTD